MPEVTTPPGLLMYMEMGALGATLSRYSSCATTRLLVLSSIGPFTQMIRSCRPQRAREHWVG